MTHHPRSRFAFSFRILLATLLATPFALASTAPYPKSRLITSISWDFSTGTSLRKAFGSDLWPMTWAADGNLYGAWGDGGGFDGDANNIGRVSLGIARVSGTPNAASSASFSGKNIWGAAPAYAENASTFGGKIDDLISIGGVLYGQGGLWTRANCACSNPTVKSGANPFQRYLTWSADLGKTWRIAPWTSTFGTGSSLQYGQDYRGAWDAAHVYFYYQQNVSADPGHLFLRRAATSQLTGDPATPGHFEYLAGVNEEGASTWSPTASRAVPIFFDSNIPSGTYAGTTVVYDAELGRYLMTAFHGDSTGQIGFFEAPAPWGPWATIAYYDDWGGFNETAGEGNGLQFPAKWIAGDGKTLWAVFSGVTNGFDSFNVVKAVLTTNAAIPRITSPAPSTKLSPGERVTVLGAGTDLSWSVQVPGTPSSFTTTGTGPTLTFTVPDILNAGTILRVTLTSSANSSSVSNVGSASSASNVGSVGDISSAGNGGSVSGDGNSAGNASIPDASSPGIGTVSVYRDYTVAASNANSEVGRWEFDEGAGLIAKDSSGESPAGLLLNGPSWTTGRVGHALSFHGDAAAVLVSASNNLANLYKTGLTATAWIRPRSNGMSGRILDKNDNTAGWFLKTNGTGLQFVADQFTGSAVIRTSSTALTLGAWQHVAVTWDGSTHASGAHLYLNGFQSDGPMVNGDGTPVDDANVPLTIGNRHIDLARGFDGIIDDVRIFNRPLTPDEIRALASSPLTSVPPSASTPTPTLRMTRLY